MTLARAYSRFCLAPFERAGINLPFCLCFGSDALFGQTERRKSNAKIMAHK